MLPGAGIAGRGVLRGGAAIAALARGVVQARGILARLDAAAVVGFGGYPSVAPVLARARCARRAAGDPARAERGAGPRQSLPGAARDRAGAEFCRDRARARGRRDGADRQPGAPGDRGAGRQRTTRRRTRSTVRLLVLGGSLGARVFSDVVPDGAGRCCPTALRHAPVASSSNAAPKTWIACAPPMRCAASPPSWRRSSPMWPTGWPRRIWLFRAPAPPRVAELAVAGRPAILVPLPGAIDDHQSANARALVAARAAAAIAQRDLHAGGRWPNNCLPGLAIPTCWQTPRAPPRRGVRRRHRPPRRPGGMPHASEKIGTAAGASA